MTTNQAASPSEQDLDVVEGQLAALHAALSPPQQALLETLVAAGLEQLDNEDDTGGYIHDMQTLYEARRMEVEQAWRKANRLGPLGDPPRPPGGERGSVLAPLLAFFRRPTAQPTTTPSRQTPA